MTTDHSLLHLFLLVVIPIPHRLNLPKHWQLTLQKVHQSIVQLIVDRVRQLLSLLVQVMMMMRQRAVQQNLVPLVVRIRHRATTTIVQPLMRKRVRTGGCRDP